MQHSKIKIAFTALFFAALTSTSFASTAIISNNTPGKKTDIVKFVGRSEQGLIFSVNYENSDAKKVYFSLKNQDGDILYQDTFKGTELNKRIVLKDETNNVSALSFVVKTSTGEYVQNFSIQGSSVAW